MQTIRLFEAFAGYGYQVAGNSIVVDVLAAIFSQLFIGNTNNNQQTELF